jgi:hypothetical protein
MNKSPIPNKDLASEPEPQPLSMEAIHSLQELGGVLKQIHLRLLSEGYIIRNGKILKPDSSDSSNGGNR